MQIGLFQLENLVLTRTPFYFADLSLAPLSEENPQLRALFAQAQKVSAEELLKRLQQASLPLTHPIVLMCENGRISGAAAAQLESSGYQNVYIVASGVEGLRSEL
jgi:rhodanese-related sulfurtransferase